MAPLRVVLTSLVVAVLVAHTEGQRPPGFAYGYLNNQGATAQPTPDPHCQYTFQVPSSNSQCLGETKLRDDLTSLRAELDKTRLQYVARNSVLQDRLDTLQQQASDYAKQVLTLQTKLHALEQQTSAQNTAGSGAPTQQQLLDTRDSFTRLLQGVESKVSNLSQAFRQDAIQQSKAGAAMEAQIQAQDVAIRDAVNKISGVERQLQALQSPPPGFSFPTSSGATGSSLSSQATPQVVQQLQAQLQQVVSDLQKYDQKQSQLYTQAEQKANTLAAKLDNHTRQLDTLDVEAQAVVSRLQGGEQQIQTTRNALIQFRQSTDPKLQQLETTVQQVASDTQALQSRVTQVATDSMDNRVKVGDEQQEVDNLKVMVKLLSLQVQDVLTNLTKEDTRIQQLARDVAAVKGGPPSGITTPFVVPPTTSAPRSAESSTTMAIPPLPSFNPRQTTSFPISPQPPGRK